MTLTGPRDIAEVDPASLADRMDLGSMLVPSIPGLQVQVQADQKSGTITQVTFALPGGAVQVQPYAAPRSGGMWDDVRGKIAASINSSGGLVETAEGPLGPELRAQVVPSDGSAGLQPARFCGIDGPRWFLRAVFLGAAARPGEAADAFEAMVRSLVVVRGHEAMPVGAPIPIRLPRAPQADAGPPPPPSPFERGPEITETR